MWYGCVYSTKRSRNDVRASRVYIVIVGDGNLMMCLNEVVPQSKCCFRFTLLCIIVI